MKIKMLQNHDKIFYGALYVHCPDRVGVFETIKKMKGMYRYIML